MREAMFSSLTCATVHCLTLPPPLLSLSCPQHTHFPLLPITHSSSPDTSSRSPSFSFPNGLHASTFFDVPLYIPTHRSPSIPSSSNKLWQAQSPLSPLKSLKSPPKPCPRSLQHPRPISIPLTTCTDIIDTIYARLPALQHHILSALLPSSSQAHMPLLSHLATTYPRSLPPHTHIFLPLLHFPPSPRHLPFLLPLAANSPLFLTSMLHTIRQCLDPLHLLSLVPSPTTSLAPASYAPTLSTHIPAADIQPTPSPHPRPTPTDTSANQPSRHLDPAEEGRGEEVVVMQRQEVEGDRMRMDDLASEQAGGGKCLRIQPQDRGEEEDMMRAMHGAEKDAVGIHQRAVEGREFALQALTGLGSVLCLKTATRDLCPETSPGEQCLETSGGELCPETSKGGVCLKALQKDLEDLLHGLLSGPWPMSFRRRMYGGILEALGSGGSERVEEVGRWTSDFEMDVSWPALGKRLGRGVLRGGGREVWEDVLRRRVNTLFGERRDGGSGEGEEEEARAETHVDRLFDVCRVGERVVVREKDDVLGLLRCWLCAQGAMGAQVVECVKGAGRCGVLKGLLGWLRGGIRVREEVGQKRGVELALQVVEALLEEVGAGYGDTGKGGWDKADGARGLERGGARREGADDEQMKENGRQDQEAGESERGGEGQVGEVGEGIGEVWRQLWEVHAMLSGMWEMVGEGGREEREGWRFRGRGGAGALIGMLRSDRKGRLCGRCAEGRRRAGLWAVQCLAVGGWGGGLSVWMGVYERLRGRAGEDGTEEEEGVCVLCAHVEEVKEEERLEGCKGKMGEEEEGDGLWADLFDWQHIGLTGSRDGPPLALGPHSAEGASTLWGLPLTSQSASHLGPALPAALSVTEMAALSAGTALPVGPPLLQGAPLPMGHPLTAGLPLVLGVGGQEDIRRMRAATQEEGTSTCGREGCPCGGATGVPVRSQTCARQTGDHTPHPDRRVCGVISEQSMKPTQRNVSDGVGLSGEFLAHVEREWRERLTSRWEQREGRTEEAMEEARGAVLGRLAEEEDWDREARRYVGPFVEKLVADLAEGLEGEKGMQVGVVVAYLDCVDRCGRLCMEEREEGERGGVVREGEGFNSEGQRQEVGGKEGQGWREGVVQRLLLILGRVTVTQVKVLRRVVKLVLCLCRPEEMPGLLLGLCRRACLWLDGWGGEGEGGEVITLKDVLDGGVDWEDDGEEEEGEEEGEEGNEEGIVGLRIANLSCWSGVMTEVVGGWEACVCRKKEGEGWKEVMEGVCRLVEGRSGCRAEWLGAGEKGKILGLVGRFVGECREVVKELWGWVDEGLRRYDGNVGCLYVLLGAGREIGERLVRWEREERGRGGTEGVALMRRFAHVQVAWEQMVEEVGDLCVKMCEGDQMLEIPSEEQSSHKRADPSRKEGTKESVSSLLRLLVGKRGEWVQERPRDVEESEEGENGEGDLGLGNIGKRRGSRGRGRKRKRRLRSRNAVVDAWLGEESGEDAFVDLENFLMEDEYT